MDSNATGFSLAQASQTVTVSYTVLPGVPVYRQATAAVTATPPASDVGDSGKVALKVSNTAAADGFSESLIAAVAATSAGFTALSSGPTADIVAGGSDTTLSVGVNTAVAGNLAGTATIGLVSDGGVGAGSIDGKGQTALTAIAAPISATVNNYAAAALSETVNGVAAAAGTTLNLGTLAQGSGPVTIALTEANIASGPADVLAATFLTSGSPAFSNALGAVSALAAGQAALAGTITLATNTAGTFSETVTATPTGSNASGYAGRLRRRR